MQYGGLLDGGQNTQARLGQQRYTVDYIGDLRHTFASQFQANLSLGAQVVATRYDSLGSTGVGFASNTSNVISSASTTSGGQQRFQTRQIGYLSQLQLGWKDRRFLQVGARLDDFSAFGDDSKAILLPKVGASWVLSDEAFAAPLTRLFPSLRLRAVYGTAGRAPTAGASLQTLQAAPYAIASGTSASSAAGAIPLNPGNANLKPEKGSEVEVGFDATVLSDRLALEVTYFDKTSKDVLLQRPLPPSQGYATNPFVNIGELNNRGVEFGLTAQLLKLRNLGWESRVNFNTLDSKIVDLGGIAPFGTLYRFTTGYQPGAIVSKSIKNDRRREQPRDRRRHARGHRQHRADVRGRMEQHVLALQELPRLDAGRHQDRLLRVQPHGLLPRDAARAQQPPPGSDGPVGRGEAPPLRRSDAWPSGLRAAQRRRHDRGRGPRRVRAEGRLRPLPRALAELLDPGEPAARRARRPAAPSASRSRTSRSGPTTRVPIRRSSAARRARVSASSRVRTS